MKEAMPSAIRKTPEGGDDEPYLQGRVLELANAAGDTHQAEHVIFELRSFDLCR